MTAFEISQKIAQDCAAQVPVIVLGSGASVPHGIPGMWPLGQHLINSTLPDGLTAKDLTGWDAFKSGLSTKDLESALTDIEITAAVTGHIVNTTWEYLNAADLAVFYQVIANRKLLPLSRLFQYLFRTTTKELQVVTPNYDRLAEYAAEAAGYYAYTGFSYGMLGNRIVQHIPKIYVNGAAQRTVNVWKVHGSFGWFCDRDGVVVSLPPGKSYPSELEPLIVTPGSDKYRRTHAEPFRTTMHCADRAISSAKAFLCIGYGFNDEHLQPLLIERCANTNVPLVLLTKVVSEKALEFFQSGRCQRYLAIEEADVGARVYTNQFPDGVDLPGATIWNLADFLDFIM